MVITDYISGFLLGLSLIIAIGSQNAFVLNQGLKREHIFYICLFCAVSDALLILAGVAGFGAVTTRYPQAVMVAKIAGVIFLVVYGLQSLYASMRRSHALQVEGQIVTSLKKSLLLCLGFTWLNPHVYLDTVVLLGSVSSRFTGNACVAFWAGAVCASTFWFLGLSLGGQLLAPLFARPAAWRLLDCLVCVIMWSIALSMICSI